MSLPIARWHGHPAPVVAQASEFAEVVYGRDEVLVVAVADNLAGDDRLAHALIDAIATCEEYATAESEIQTIAEAFQLDVRFGRHRRERQLILIPRRLA